MFVKYDRHKKPVNCYHNAPDDKGIVLSSGLFFIGLLCLGMFWLFSEDPQASLLFHLGLISGSAGTIGGIFLWREARQTLASRPAEDIQEINRLLNVTDKLGIELPDLGTKDVSALTNRELKQWADKANERLQQYHRDAAVSSINTRLSDSEASPT